jgi:hypothetical protein
MSLSKNKCNILYMLGAGGSANALPLVKSFKIMLE